MGLAQNEMKAKPALPERVRSMEGLDGILDEAQSSLVDGMPLLRRRAKQWVPEEAK